MIDDDHAQARPDRFLQALRDEWRREGETLFAGPTAPSRARLIDGALSAAIRAMLLCGFSITEVARRCDTSRRAVRDTMKRLKLYKPRKPPKRKPIDWDTVGLGVRLDTEIAREHGCSVTLVRSERLSRGIARADRRGRKAAKVREAVQP